MRKYSQHFCISQITQSLAGRCGLLTLLPLMHWALWKSQKIISGWRVITIFLFQIPQVILSGNIIEYCLELQQRVTTMDVLD